VALRLENLDRQRSTAALVSAMQRDLEWFGLSWDTVVIQDQFHDRHEAALDQLAAAGRLYPCRCSRAQRRAAGRRAPDGGWAYDNRCRGRALPGGDWRACDEPLRARLADEPVRLVDDSGLDLTQTPAYDMGDPIVRRRDGAIAYHLATVVDDAAAGVDRVVRGRDLATSTATQVALAGLLGLPVPSYRHHFLLLETRGDKLAKLHGAVGADELRAVYSAEALCGLLAHWAGLQPTPKPCTPTALLATFSWSTVRQRDLTVIWDGQQLTADPDAP